MRKSTLERLVKRIRAKSDQHTDSTAATVEANQTTIAQQSVDTHANKRQYVHGVGPEYVAKTPRADQRTSWNDLADKPDLTLADMDLDDIFSVEPVNNKAPRAPATGDPTINDGWLSFAIARIADLTWSNITGKPTTFPPEAHFHGLSDLLQGSATSGQVATWTGTEWTPVTPTAGASIVAGTHITVEYDDDTGQTTINTVATITPTTNAIPQARTDSTLAPAWMTDHFQRRIIPSGETLTVPEDFSMVVVGALTIDGVLIIDGAVGVI